MALSLRPQTFCRFCSVIKVLRRWFADLGVPETLKTDNGPHFSCQRFADFRKNWQIDHVTSSPHYPLSTGHAEAAVKALKTLVLKTTNNGNLDVDSFHTVRTKSLGMAQHAGSQGPDVVRTATYLVFVCPPILLFYRLARKDHRPRP